MTPRLVRYLDLKVCKKYLAEQNLVFVYSPLKLGLWDSAMARLSTIVMNAATS